MRKGQIISPNNNQKEEKHMNQRTISLKKSIISAIFGTLMAVMLLTTTCFAAGDTSAVTQPLDNLKPLIIAVIGAVGVIILAKNVMEFAQAYQQHDSSTMNSALKGVVAGVMMAGISGVLAFWNNQISLVFTLLGQSPAGFKGGGPWGIIQGIEPIFVAVGSSLVVLFFVIGFCSESIDVKGEPIIKAFEMEQNGQVKKKGKKTQSEITTSESAVKKQEEFEEMKKKTRNMMFGLAAVFVLAVAGVAAYKAMH